MNLGAVSCQRLLFRASVFLDKSGSMGCEQNSFFALCLAAERALAPQTGSCMLFLMAGPGDTQIFFSRAGTPSHPARSPHVWLLLIVSHLRARSVGSPNMPEPIRLGASTWFNEPVFIVLKALAPVVEQLDLPALRMVRPVPILIKQRLPQVEAEPGARTMNPNHAFLQRLFSSIVAVWHTHQAIPDEAERGQPPIQVIAITDGQVRVSCYHRSKKGKAH
eukprot:SAG11_NODE_3769_length_2237_cov_1.175865_2_plen_220_part_00